MKTKHSIFNIAVVVAALGYFVDVYDLLLFGIIRVPSLESLGLSPADVKASGELILQWQMWGLLLGGIISGVMGDKRGRLSVLFGSIILYSLANIANGFVETVEQYKWIRFIAGLGLAGELGAGITLVSEIVPKEKRGLATSLVAGIGLSGAVLAYFMKQSFDWRTCYFIGGGLGVLLLLLRISVFESGLYNQVKQTQVERGNFLSFFTKPERFRRYLFGILIGLPTWFVIGILITFSNDFAKEFGITEKIDPGKAIMYAYVAISVGDILIGLLSQYLQSRKKALFIFYGITILFMIAFFTLLWGASASRLYLICAGLGFGTGFWAIFVTMGAEQFGTNLRATAATTIPNMVRGMLAVVILPLFKWFEQQPAIGTVNAGIYTGIIIMSVTVLAAALTQETFHKDLDYLED
jgi:putative MFS transporter